MINELKAVVSADASGFNDVMNSIGITSAGAAGAVVAAFAAATAAVVALEKEVIGSASAFEDMEASLQIVLGDASKGSRIFKEIRDQAAQLPVDTKAGIEAFTTLLSLAGEDVAADQWKNIALISEALGKNASTASSAIGSMMLKLKTGSSGMSIIETLTSRDVSQTLGKATQDIVKMARAGADNEAILQAINAALEEQGTLAEKSLGATLSGKLATAMGGLDLEKAGLGAEPLQFAKDALDALVKSMESADFSKIGDALSRFAEVVTAVVSGSGFNTFLEYAINLTAFLIDGITGLVAILGSLLKTLEPVVALFNKLQEAWTFLTDKGLDLVMPGSNVSAEETRAMVDERRLQREANKRLIAAYPMGPPAQ